MFRLTIRDILWLTTVAGIGLGWLMDHRLMVGVVADRDETIDLQKHDVNRARLEARYLLDELRQVNDAMNASNLPMP